MNIKMKLATGLVCLLIGAFSCSNAFADILKIGVMNVQKVLIQSEPGKNAKAKFEEKKKAFEEKFTAEQETLQNLQIEIEKKGSMWSKEKKDEKMLEFKQMRRELKSKTEDASLEMKQLQDKMLEPILKTLETVVDEFGEKNGFTAILDSKSGVIYFDKAIDISDALIEDLNKAMK